MLDTTALENLLGKPDHHIYTGAPIGRPTSRMGFDYWMAGNGIFIHGENRFIRAIFKIADCEIRGLPDIAQEIRPKHSKIPISLLESAADDMRDFDREVMYNLVLSDKSLTFRRIPQSGTASNVDYNSDDYGSALADLHSHCALPAFFSHTDDSDEQGFRWYMVIGDVWKPRPTFAIRVGVHGYHCGVSITTLFDSVGKFDEGLTFSNKLPPVKVNLADSLGANRHVI